MSQVTQNLCKARNLISKPEHWCKGARGKDINGNCVYGWRPGADPNTHSRCALGAIEAVIPASWNISMEVQLLYKALPDYSEKIDIEVINCAHYVAYYNNNHIHADILAVFDKAINLSLNLE
jgi:hypothetical protein